MKKVLILALCFVFIFSVGCVSQKEDPNSSLNEVNDSNNKVETPVTETEKSLKENEESKSSVEEYFPLFSDKIYSYTGEGIEYASYVNFSDFVDEKANKIQLRANNGGTEVIKVIQIEDGSVIQLFSKENAFYRDNLLTGKEKENREILLKEPLVKGTKWSLDDGRVRSITGTDITLETPAGKFSEVIEVTTEGKDSIIKDYYAKNTGLIKTVFESEGVKVVSTLEEIKENATYESHLDIFYPTDDGKIKVETKKINFKTNDITRLKVEEILKQEPSSKNLSSISTTNTKINSMYLGPDNIAYIDFSKDLITEMNAGSGYETLILQSIVNTIGNYYGVDKVYLTIEGEPYESGHISFEQGELLKVNMENVVH